jgi:hypothetical protein
VDWPITPDMAEAVEQVRALAREGLLAETVRSASCDERRRLNAATYVVAGPLVFQRVTRIHEQRRGHWACATSVFRLADGCLDRFYDDTQAVIDAIFAQVSTPIQNLDGWIVRHVRTVAIDAYRRRRADRGALQRPRLPGWLAQSLLHDPWLSQLAIEILTWVGVPATSGTSLWPLDSWAEQRARATDDWTGSDAHTVSREVTHVLAMMQVRPQWYADHVERPLGRKTPPVAPALVERGTDVYEPPALALIEQHEIDDARLRELASAALDAIEACLARDPDAERAVVSIIEAAFGSDHAVVLFDDPAEVNRVVRTVRDILRGPADGRTAA